MKFILFFLFCMNLSFAQTVEGVKIEKEQIAKSDKISKEDILQMEQCVGKTSLNILLNKEVFLNKDIFLRESKFALAKQNKCINFFVDYVKKYNNYIDDVYYKAIVTTSKRINLEKKYIEAVISKMKGATDKDNIIQGFSLSINFFMEQEMMNWKKVPLKDDLTTYSEEKEEKSFILKALIYLFNNLFIVIFLALVFFLLRIKLKKNKLDNEEDELDL